MRGKLESIGRRVGKDSNFTAFTVVVDDKDGKYYEALNKLENADVDAEIEKHYDKRSIDANAYMWVLCTAIAKAISYDKIVYTKEDVYRETISRVGTFKDYPMFTAGVDDLRELWSSQGTGWITEIVDYLPDNSGYLVRCYYGSSSYDSAQISRLIDCLIQDCDALGIDHRTPDEIADMISLWDNYHDKSKR